MIESRREKKKKPQDKYTIMGAEPKNFEQFMNDVSAAKDVFDTTPESKIAEYGEIAKTKVRSIFSSAEIAGFHGCYHVREGIKILSKEFGSEHAAWIDTYSYIRK